MYISTKEMRLLSVFLLLIGIGVFVLVFYAIYKTRTIVNDVPTERDNSSTQADDSGVTPAGINSVINGNNQFALNLYSNLIKQEPSENIFFSPYSISTALAMTYEGARGKTASEIQSVFFYPTDDNVRRSAFAAIHNQINSSNSKYSLTIANALWAQKDYKFLNEYLDITEKYYAAKTENLDFIGSEEKSRQVINKWVEDKTNNKIKEILKDTLSPNTRLILTNAIYFKGVWLKQFEKDQTEERDFFITPTNKVKVPMMRRVGEEAKFNYTEAEDIQVLEMPYEGDKLSMLVILPKENNLGSVENSLTLDKINDWRNRLTEQKMEVYIPKFKFDTRYMMNDVLSQMGMPTAFSGTADFSGMDGTQNLFIDSVIHQAFIEVDEKGTEAAAATAVVMELKMAVLQYPIFNANHPFIFIIQDKVNGNILFIGKVVDPSK